MNRTQHIRNLIHQALDQVDAIYPVSMRRLMPALGQARAELEAGITRWLRNAPTGDAPFTVKQMRLALLQIRATEDAVRRGVPAIRSALQAGGEQAARLAVKWTGEEMRRFSMAFGNKLELPPIDLPTAEHLLHENNWLLSRYESSAARYSTRQRLWLRRQFTVGILKNETMGQLIARIHGGSARGGVGTSTIARGVADRMFSHSYHEAERLVRTELIHAYNSHHQASIEALAESQPGMLKRWDASGDKRMCSLCRELDGQTVAPGRDFAGGVSHPPRHPSCFAPGTRIAGDVIGASKARYAGSLIELVMRSGRRLSVTPNHPILTAHGFVPAGELDYGAQVFCDFGNAGVAAGGVGVEIDKDNSPSSAEEIFDFLVKRYATSRFSSSAGDFHGDAFFFKDHVHVVDMSRPLECCHVWDGSSDFGDVEPAWFFGMSAMDGNRPPFSLGDGLLTTPGSIVRGLSLAGSDFLAHERPLDRLRLGLIAQWNAKASKPQIDNVAAHAEFMSQLIDGSAGNIRADKVVQINRFDFDGHVYDFQTTGGWLSADGVIASNCRCVLVAWMSDWPDIGPTRRQAAMKARIDAADEARRQARQ